MEKLDFAMNTPLRKPETGAGKEAFSREYWKIFAEKIMARGELHRNLDNYLSFFALQPDDIKDKKILDIGAGAAMFAKEAEKYGADVVALDLIYAHEEGRGKKFLRYESLGDKFNRLRKGEKRHDPKALAGLAQDLPFKNGSFDYVVSVFSSFMYARSIYDLEKSFDESLRVLKKDGKMLVFPLCEPEIIGKGPAENCIPELLVNTDNQLLAKELNAVFWNKISGMEEKGLIKKQICNPSFDFRQNPDDMKAGTEPLFTRSLVIQKIF